MAECALEGKTATAPSEISRAANLRHAGFWIRFAATIIDFVILALPLAVFVSFLSVAMGPWMAFLKLHPGETREEILAQFGPKFLSLSLGFFALISWLYFAALESSSLRGTLGKRVLGLYVGDLGGNRIGFWQASRRFFAGRLLMQVPYVGIYYFVVDCACAGLTPGKRAIHDMLAGCQVLRDAEDSARRR